MEVAAFAKNPKNVSGKHTFYTYPKKTAGEVSCLVYNDALSYVATNLARTSYPASKHLLRVEVVSRNRHPSKVHPTSYTSVLPYILSVVS